MKIVTETRPEEENRSEKSSRETCNENSRKAFALTEVRKSFGVLFDSALDLVIRALAPNILKTVGLKS